MKRLNVLAASLIAATLVTLSLVPLTRDALRFDMQMAGGRQILSKALLDLGVRQSDLPFGGFGPHASAAAEPVSIASNELPVRLASATQLPGRKKWAALQTLVAEYPKSAAAHATLARMACKNGGAVGVGHQALQDELQVRSFTPAYTGQKDPNAAEDAAILLRSCEAGEKLDPDNAYFPAMAAVAHLSLDQDALAQQALHRAAEKSRWDEYIPVEAQGAIRRAELVYGPQNSLSESATLAMILFPHYAALRGMGRVVTAQAMHLEQAGDFKAGLTLRRDVALLGETMRDQSSSLIGGLVGSALVRVSEGRPGGAPALKQDEKASKALDTQFHAYLTVHGQDTEAAQWAARLAVGDATRALVLKGTDVSVFSSTTLFQTQWRLLASLALLGAVTLLCVLGGLALLRPWLGRKLGRGAAVLSVGTFLAVLAWQGWQGIGNLRDCLAYGSVIQGLAGGEASQKATEALLRQALALETSLAVVALLSPFVLLVTSAVRALRRNEPLGQLLRRNTLPLAAVLTLVYAGHLVAFSLRERTIQAELQRVIHHEGRYIAEKLGQPWPTMPQ